MVMVFVPGGTFQMGSAEGDLGASSPEFPQHAVTLDGFWIDGTEVTNAQYDRCVETGQCWPAGFAEDEERTGEDYPVETVSWYNAVTYCEWAGGRLPTEAEWEYAARGPDGHLYPWGDQAPTTDLCTFDNNVIGTTSVGAHPAGASWCGALDMAGNVAEWMADWYDESYYEGSPDQNPTGPAEGEFKVVRGGSWGSDEVGVRAADRSYHIPPDHIYGGVGFRCVTDQQ
jgi:serine/threonine-protein kinase